MRQVLMIEDHKGKRKGKVYLVGNNEALELQNLGVATLKVPGTSPINKKTRVITASKQKVNYYVTK